jgi:hypothetical protein
MDPIIIGMTTLMHHTNIPAVAILIVWEECNPIKTKAYDPLSPSSAMAKEGVMVINK